VPEATKRAFRGKYLKNNGYGSLEIPAEENGRLIYRQYFLVVCS
jgi:hypothetical protein